MAATGHNILTTSDTISFRDQTTGVASITYDYATDTLSISNDGTGSISFGDTASDIYIGDGTSNVDLIFEANGAIKGDAGVDLTLGSSDSNIFVASPMTVLENASFSGSLTVGGNPVMTGVNPFDEDTLQTVTDRGSSTTNTISALAITGTAGLNQFKGSTADSASYTIVARNSSNTSLFSIRNDGRLDIPVGPVNIGNNLYLDNNEIWAQNSNNLNVKAAGDVKIQPNDGATTAATFKSDGKVGIGTTNPIADLHVNGDVQIGSSTQPNSYGALQVNQTSNVDEEGIGVLSASAGRSIRIWVDETRSYINSGNGGSGILVLNEGAGNVGIGTTSPSQKLDVNGVGSFVGGTVAGVIDTQSAGIYLSTTGRGLSANFSGYARNLINHLTGGIIEIGQNTSLINHIKINAGSSGTNGIVTLLTKGAEQMRITADGNVGIGTTDPSTKLNLYSNGTDTLPQLTIQQDGAGDAGLRFLAGGNAWSLGLDNSGGDYFGISNVNYGIDTGAEFVITQAGNVGIGTAGPSYKLDVAGNAARIGNNLQTTTSLFLTATNTAGAPARAVQTVMAGYEGRGIGTFYTDTTYSGEEWFCGMNYSGNFDRWSVGYDPSGGQPEYLANVKFTINSSGNVGIGTSSPQTKLHVNGSIGAYTSDYATGSTGSRLLMKTFASTGNTYSLIQAQDVGGISNNVLALQPYGDNVGIGTTSPDQKLEVNGNAHLNYSLIGRGIRSSNRGELHLNATSTNDVSEIFFGYGDGYTEGNIRWAISDRGFTDGRLDLYRGPAFGGFSAVQTWDENGNVGIGVDSPAAKLHVKGTALRLEEAGSSARHLDIVPAVSGSNHRFTSTTTGSGFNFEYWNGSAATVMASITSTGLTVNSGSIVLSGTGRIQGVDTVTNATDAANKAYVDAQVGSADTLQEVTDNGNTFSADLLYTNSGTAQKIDNSNYNGLMHFNASRNIGFHASTADVAHIHSYSETHFKFGSSHNSANTTAMLIKSDGKVGIGTTSPTQKLDVAGTVKATSYFLGSSSEISLATTGAGNVFLRPNGQSTSGQMQLESSGNAIFAGNIIIPQPKAFTFANSQTIRDNGGGGLAIRVPIYRLDLIAGTDAGNGHITFQTNNGTERMRVSNGGNVGIGTTSPTQKTVISGPNTAPSLNSTAVSSATLLLANSDTYYGTYFASLANGVGLIQQRRQTSNTTYSLALNPYGGKIGIGTVAPNHTLDVEAATDDVVASFNSLDNKCAIALNDDDTTVYLSAENGKGAFGFQAGTHANNLNIDVSGNVGIGTNNPGTKLHVGAGSSATVDTGYQIVAESSGIAGIQILSATNQSGRVVFGDSGDNDIGMIKYDHTDNSMGFRTNGSGNERMRITSAGNVGIGTTNPAEKLELFSASDVALRIHKSSVGEFRMGVAGSAGSDTAQFITNTNGFDFRGDSNTFPDGGSSRLFISSTGNVGIGTTSPNVRLELRREDSGDLFELNRPASGVSALYGGVSSNDPYLYSNNGIFSLGVNNPNGGLGGEVAYITMRNGSTRYTTFEAGNVGIGTDNPDTKLHVVGSNYENFTVQSTSSGYAPASVICEAGNSNTRGAGIFMHNTVNDRIWYAGTMYNDNSNAWNLSYNSDASALGAGRTSMAQNSYSLFTVTNTGSVGIGTTSPEDKLDIAGKLRISDNKTANTNKTNRIRGEHYDIAQEPTTFMFMNNFSTVNVLHIGGGSTIENAATTLNFYTAANNTTTQGSNRMVIDSSGNVGIGTTNPTTKFHIDDNATSGTGLLVTGGGVGNPLATFTRDVGGSGSVEISSRDSRPQIKFAASSNTFALGVNGSTFEIADNTALGTNARLSITNTGNVGIGTTSPAYTLDVATSGGIRAGGKITYHKSAGSLDTTGYAVAGLVTGYNGNSSGFTFTCFGNTGDYQRVVYSCYNAAGTWNTQKVIDEGTNDFDVVASANGSTVTFTFKSRSGTKNYTPRVSVEALGHSINNTYA